LSPLPTGPTQQCTHFPYPSLFRCVPCQHGMARPQVADVRWVPCHHGMARPSVADVRWVPCHHGMARPQVADGADGLLIWRVAANILNKLSRAADKMWSSCLGVGQGDNSSPQNTSFLRNVTQGFGTGRIHWINDLS
jgi:hypothetical protein